MSNTNKLTTLLNSLDLPHIDSNQKFGGLKGSKNLVHQKIISNYVIHEKIGAGGFAEVKKAKHIPTGITVAVKIISLVKLSSNKRSSLEIEIDIHKRVVHQNIAKLYEVYRTDSEVYIFMEYCEKGELFDYINRHGALQKDLINKIFGQVYSATCYLHQNKISHRDIKTENILLDANMNAKLIDFGLSKYYKNDKLEDQEMMMMKTFCGSPCYLSPQMITKKQYNAQAVDVWCLGIVLYAMVMAQLPFCDNDRLKLQRKIIQTNYNRVMHYPEYDKLIDRMLKFQDQRIKLQDIREQSFMKEQNYKPNFLNLFEQRQAIDLQIIQQISVYKGIQQDTLQHSIKKFKVDPNYGMYYIFMQKMRKQGKGSCYDVNSSKFMKKMRSSDIIGRKRKSLDLQVYKRRAQTLELRNFSLIKLKPIEKKLNIFQQQNQKIRHIRKRNNKDPESPKRLIDDSWRYSKRTDYLVQECNKYDKYIKHKITLRK